MNSPILRHVLTGSLWFALACSAASASADQTVIVEGDDPGTGGPNPYLLGSGILTLGVSYAPAVAVAVISDRGADQNLYAPVVGPWMDLAARDCRGACGLEKVNKALLVVDGVVQAMGALQIVASLVYVGGHADTAVAADTTPTVMPARLSGDGYGLLAAGRF